MALKLKKNASGEGDEFKKLLEKEDFLKVPKLSETVLGTVIYASRNEVRLDLSGMTIGVVRGNELYNESPDYANIKIGDQVEATVIDLENENGEVELSFRYAGHKKAWDDLHKNMAQGTVLSAAVLDANKGGLMVRVGHILGFLPVSQLNPDHYPRVPGGDKGKILELLKQFVGKTLQVKIIDIVEKEEKLIVSEKDAWEDSQHSVVSSYKVHDVVEGHITTITEFGAFMEFGDEERAEGLIHISELAWQRIDHPREIVKNGDRVKAEIIHIDGQKIFLSMKNLKEDPWVHVGERYKLGQTVSGTVLKVNLFGLFVELDPEIHGLAHISELSSDSIRRVQDIAKPGNLMQFKIISMDPQEHRLGLSLKALKQEEESSEKKTDAAEPLESVAEQEKENVSNKQDVSITTTTENLESSESSSHSSDINAAQDGGEEAAIQEEKTETV